ncbi:hypothetical protein WJX84_008368 [Apatococcus fuscideae]|uniref:NYN domain-containing protein n=1 Tax=Apatococcus fuscideae TaxID=2026836 RepID=A0AAW1T7M8_9CHLO
MHGTAGVDAVSKVTKQGADVQLIQAARKFLASASPGSTVVLITGDAGFKALADQAKITGCHFKLMSLPKSCSSQLKAKTEDWRDWATYCKSISAIPEKQNPCRQHGVVGKPELFIREVQEAQPAGQPAPAPPSVERSAVEREQLRGMGQNSRKRQRQPTPAPAPVPVRSADPSQDAKDIDVTPCFSFYNMVMELYATGGTAQVAREFVSNSIDSRSRSIKFAPFPFPADKAGFAVADDGHGMSRPSKDQRPDGPLSGLSAFESLAMSSRTGDKDAIGHKGIGTKSYFLSNHGLIVVTKTKADADWACLQLANPMEWLLSATSTSQDSGTLILVLGFVGADHSGQQQRTFQSLLQEVEGYDETVKPKGKAIAKQGKPELLTYITHKTALGQPFTRHALDRSGFDSNQIDWCAQSGILREADLPSFHYQVRSANAGEQFKMQELAAGYNFIPIKPVPSASPETDDPLLIEQKHWRVATFQDRYLEWIEHDGKKYGVAVAVDGQGLRFKHYTGMNRKGVKGSPLLGLSVNHFTGVQLFARNVHVCNDRKIFKALTDHGFGKLADEMYAHQISVLINGDFGLGADRTKLDNQSEEIVNQPGFLDKLAKVLSNAKKHQYEDSTFGKLMKRIDRDHRASNSAQIAARQTRTTQRIEDAMTRPIVIRIGNPHAGRPVMVSDYEPTAEAAVQQLYSAICQHFIYHPQLLGDPSGPSGGSLIDWWPELRNAHSGEGIDTFGVMRSLAEDWNPHECHDRVMAEFKHEWEVPIARPNSNSSFNHDLIGVDFIICWTFRFPGQPSCFEDRQAAVHYLEQANADPGKAARIIDKEGCTGRICQSYSNHQGQRIEVPERLHGFAFLVDDIRDSSGDVLVPDKHRMGHNIVRVVSLKGLMEATFNQQPLSRMTWGHAGS